MGLVSRTHRSPQPARAIGPA